MFSMRFRSSSMVRSSLEISSYRKDEVRSFVPVSLVKGWQQHGIAHSGITCCLCVMRFSSWTHERHNFLTHRLMPDYHTKLAL